METDASVRKTDMDRLLVYRNLLAAEDHIDEILFYADADDRLFLEGLKSEIEEARDMIMPEEVDKDFHCLVKHLSLAFEGSREIYKETKNDKDSIVEGMVQNALNASLEKLWGHKLIKCERCGNEDGLNGIQEEDRGNSTGPINY